MDFSGQLYIWACFEIVRHNVSRCCPKPFNSSLDRDKEGYLKVITPMRKDVSKILTCL